MDAIKTAGKTAYAKLIQWMAAVRAAAPGLWQWLLRLPAHLAWIGRMLGRLLTAVFGQWTAPGWAQWLDRQARLRTAQGLAWVRANPPKALAAVMVAAGLVAGLQYAWQWYQNRPKPIEIDFALSEPGITCYSCEPQGQPHALRVRFDASVAPLELVGKPVDPKTSGIELSPALPGTWTWETDSQLVFQPSEDWPIAQEFELEFAKRGFAASHIHLAKYSIEFITPKFETAITGTEFYQDPVNAAEKKVVVTVGFTHPVDQAGFEQRLKLQMFTRTTDDLQDEVKPSPKFSVTYDKYKLHAYVHTERLAVQTKRGRTLLTIDSGVRAARGGNKTEQELTSSTEIPSLNSLEASGFRFDIARDEKDDPSQIMLLDTSYSVTESAITSKVRAWILPDKHPDAKLQAEWEKYNAGQPFGWSGASQVTPAVLKAAQPLKLGYVPNEEEHVEHHSFRYLADPGKQVYVLVDKGMTSFGGFVMAEPGSAVLTVPEFPKELHIAQQGSLLAMSGQKKLTVFTRGVQAIRVEIGRLLPKQLQHLVSQTNGEFGQPGFNNYDFNAGNITERFTKVIKLPRQAPGEAHYEAIDLGDYLDNNAGDRRGTFLVKVQVYDLEKDGALESQGGDEDCEGECWGQISDSRMVVVTDIGLIVKKAADGAQDLYAQSIATGEPLSGVSIEVMGRNGEPLMTQSTDETGHVRFEPLKNFRNERKPLLYLARRGGDSSFMPLDGRAKRLDLSRFDVGGVTGGSEAGKLSAYLFSDRGIYRPGDEIRAGLIVKSLDWKTSLKGVPLEVEIIDPRGQRLRKQTIALSAAGFEELLYSTRETSPTGSYTFNIFIPREDERRDLIGSMQVRVQEFLPDRLRMTASLSAASAEGWVSPDDLKAHISLQNLFGTPAENRRVTASMTLTPNFPSFARWKDYQFLDPQAAKEGFNDELAETTTDVKGEAQFELNLQRFSRATYRLHLVAQGYEAEGGRGVAAETVQVVSSLPYLVGYKTDGDLGYLTRGSDRNVEFIAIDPSAKRIALDELRLQRVERRYVSVLMKQDNGTYKYESRPKEIKLDERAFRIGAKGGALKFDTTTPGHYFYALVDRDGQQYAKVEYNVAGEANLTRSLDKNAELQIVLSKKDYAPGEDIEMQVTAPYVGAGLITIERDKVYAHRWFKTATTSSVQRIRMPEGIEGDAYVSVSFVRDPGSAEIYTSPLSYGVRPFSIALDARRNAVTLNAPALVKPGETVKFSYSTARPSRIVLFAVDEGILQVARYAAPDPLAHFFSKHALEVDTRQILDLILPDFARMQSSSAPGGDGEGAIGRHLNPFKRKVAKPVAWWSGIVNAGPQPQVLEYRVPDYFNGSLRVMAVAVDENAIGTADGKVTVRGDFVLSPNAPTTVSPGDEFEVSVGVSNNVIGSGSKARVSVRLDPSKQLEILGPAQQTVEIAELHEGSTRFKVRARDDVGGASLKFSASLPGKSASQEATLSVRPATPYMTQLAAGILTQGARGSQEVAVREMYPQYRKLEAGVSILPLSLAHGLAAYLGSYPHVCTEQLSSMAMPSVVLASRPEFGKLKDDTGKGIAGLVEELRLRQNADGAYRYWPGGTEVEEFVSLYAQQILLEAMDRGHSVPRDLVESGNRYLRTVAQRDGDNLEQERGTAYAIYLLTRQGNVMSNEAASLQKRFDDRYAKEWREDIAAAYLASAYQLMKQQSLADKAIAGVKLGGEHAYNRWHGGLTSDAELLYLTARHFPGRLKKLPAEFLDQMVKRVRNGQYHSLSAATTILALDQYVRVVGGSADGRLHVEELARDGKLMRELPLPPVLFPNAEFSAQAAKLRLSTETENRAYYLVTQAGFDRQPPTKAIKQGFEIIREYTGKDGKPVTQVKMGEEMDVHVKFRTVDHAPVWDAALVDLLPGGFELVIPSTPVQRQQRLSAPAQERAPEPSGDEGDYDGEGDYEGGDESEPVCGFCVDMTGYLSYAEPREDRVVFYGQVSAEVQEYVYRVRATNAGVYTVPPAYGESMYDRQVQARSVAAKIEVTR